MAFVDDDEVEEVGAELLVDILFFLCAADGLVEREVDFVGLVDALGGFVDAERQFVGDGLPGFGNPFDAFLVDAQLGHCALEGLEVVDHRLVDEDVAVGEEEDAAVGVRFPEAPDDLEGGVGLAGAGGHDQQGALLAFGDGFDGAVDGDDLVVTRGLAGVVIILFEDRCGFGRDALPGEIALPELFRRGEGVQTDLLFQNARSQGLVVEDEAVAIAGKGERQVEHSGVVERLLDTVARCVGVVLGFDDGERNARLVVEDVVGATNGALVASGAIATHDDATGGEIDFLAHLAVCVPTCCRDSRGDELGADIAFAERAFCGGFHAGVVKAEKGYAAILPGRVGER